jgi:hypothetical protein
MHTQHRHVKKREMPADTYLPVAGRSHYGKRAAVARYDVIQNLLDRTNVGLSLLVAAERHSVGRCNVLMDQQTCTVFASTVGSRGKPSNRAEWHPGSLMATGPLYRSKFIR